MGPGSAGSPRSAHRTAPHRSAAPMPPSGDSRGAARRNAAAFGSRTEPRAPNARPAAPQRARRSPPPGPARPRSLGVARAPGQAAAAVAGALHRPPRVVVGAAQFLGRQLQEGRPAERRHPRPLLAPGPAAAATAVPGLGRGLRARPGAQPRHQVRDRRAHPQQHAGPSRAEPRRAPPPAPPQGRPPG